MGAALELLANMVYGFVSGIAEFLPISSHAHQVILDHMLNLNGSGQLRGLLVHVAMLAALMTCCTSLFSRFGREQRKATRRGGRLSRVDMVTRLESRLIKTAAIPMVLGYIILNFAASDTYSLGNIALFLVINGLVLYLPEHLIRGNKDPRSMSALDAVLMGLCAAFSFFPGISRIACVTSVAVGRGADKGYAMNWALLLSVPALIVMIVLDLIVIVTQGVGTISLGIVVGSLAAALAAFAGAYIAIGMLKVITSRTGYSVFAYYAWGAALFSVILSLIV